MVSSIVDGLRRAGFVVLLGAVAGLATYLAGGGPLSPSNWSPVVAGNHVLVGILYAALVDATVRLLRLVMEAFVPLRSPQSVAAHALAPAGGVLAVVIGLTFALKGTLGATFATSWPLLLGAGGIVSIAVAIGAGFVTLQQYHRQERRDQAEGWQAHMRRLRTQTCPPVLFTTLDAVRRLLDEHPEDAAPLLNRLQSLLQYRHRTVEQPMVPLADELEAAVWYTDLAQLQFGDDLDVGFDVPDSLLSARIPRLSLLPLLENAVQHGIAGTEASCTITVTGRHDDAQLCLAVLDTGPGFDTTDPDVILRRGSGLADLYARLREHFGDAAELSLLPQGVLWCAPLASASSPDAPSEKTVAPSDPEEQTLQ